jgi:hypothetical protein
MEITIFDVPETEIAITKTQKQLEYEELIKITRLDPTYILSMYQMDESANLLKRPSTTLPSIMLKYIIQYCMPILLPDESESEKNYLAKNSILKKVCLNLTFFIVFIGTVSIWRGIWTMQLELCYPIIYESVVLNQNLLNLIYFVVSILILWYFDLVSAMLSRSSCEDSYFEIKKNCIVRQNHFKVYFQSKKKVFLI